MPDIVCLLFPMAGPEARENSVLMVDELFSASPHKLSFPEASLCIMITRNFRPRTRLSMASRMLINERQRLIQTGAGVPDPHVSLSVPGKGAMENGTGANAAAEPSQGTRHPESEETAIPGETVEGEQKEGGERTGPLLPFNIPGQRCEVLKWLFSWPLGFLLYCTVPDCAHPPWEKWIIAAFLCSTLWIGLFSDIMVCRMVEWRGVLGRCRLRRPPSVSFCSRFPQQIPQLSGGPSNSKKEEG
ncbi:sodium/potassium/calcium exchanger 3-like [Chiloscyllium punctatum]|uniref:sodium/potassium/calcium exchanger 3-like n=1 Tax=Chiloscyllium punctatum TaxID=137246 RepID=UPI003B6408C9